MTSSPDRIDCAVVGAGVIGLAVARELALAGREVVVLEAARTIGSGISSRNSEVVHAGMYYAPGSMKARLCVEGNRLLKRFALEHGVPLRSVGKLIVATNEAEDARLKAILENGRINGVDGLEWIDGPEARRMEPELACVSALYSPGTAIIDAHALMLALQGDAEEKGAVVAFGSPVVGGRAEPDGVVLEIGGPSPCRIKARTVVLCAGLSGCRVGRSFGLANVPPDRLCKGNYFSLAGRTPFQRLVYPVPVDAGLGVHFTVDMAGRGRFGPDVEWTDSEDYSVDAGRAASFEVAVRRYWPGLPSGALEPAYAGIRPKISHPGEPAADFAIHGPAEHGMPGVVALYGIESPGLTSSLALGKLVRAMAA